MLRYLRSMGGCIGLYNRPARDSDTSEESSFTTHNRPLKHRKPKWKSNICLTESQLNAKREEFWDTAPAFEGCKEIWDALRASVNALEAGDYQMAQVILDGANISLPNGTLMDCYDELGNRYQLPVYVLSAPINLIRKEEEKANEFIEVRDETSSAASKGHRSKRDREETGREIPIRIRFSTGDDYRLMVNSSDLVASVKCSLVRCLPGVDPVSLRFFFAGKQLSNNSTLASAKIDSNYTIQATISEPQTNSLVQGEVKHSQKHHSKHGNKYLKHFKLATNEQQADNVGVAPNQRQGDQMNCKSISSCNPSETGSSFSGSRNEDGEPKRLKRVVLPTNHVTSNQTVLFELPT